MNLESLPSIERLKLHYARNERAAATAFFALGFVFDIFTVGRIDSWFTIAQQALYLGVVGFALTQMLLQAGAEGWWGRWRSNVVHFLLGALLNLYTIFFFKSSSLLVSFSFLGFLLALVVANETPRFKALGLPFKFALLALCLLSFAAAVVPVFVGSIGLGVFLLSMAVGAAPLAKFEQVAHPEQISGVWELDGGRPEPPFVMVGAPCSCPWAWCSSPSLPPISSASSRRCRCRFPSSASTTAWSARP